MHRPNFRLPRHAGGFILIASIPTMALAGAAVSHFDAPIPSVAELAPARARVAAREAAPRQLARVPLDGALGAVRDEMARGAFPGAALAAGRGPRVEMIEGVGATTWGGAPVDGERTVYDLASLTKVVATTTAAMLLYEDGRLDLDAPVRRYLPAFSGGAKDRVTIRQLLAHTSGLPAGAPTRGATRQARVASLVGVPLKNAPGSAVTYSDVGFVVLAEALERAADEPLPDLLDRRVFQPLGMRATRFSPGAGCASCAPTSRTYPKGVVHDPTARALGGIAGSAGLFSTAADLSRYAAMLAGGGELEGKRVLKEETIRTFAQRQPGAAGRALGWEVPKGTTGPVGESMSRRAFGHTGFTGTSLWVDPERKTWAVLLTNRTYDARASNRMQALRRQVHAYVTQSAEVGDARAGVLAE